jgi:hypothetical protein
MDDYTKLEKALKRAKIAYEIRDTGGSVKVLFIPLPDGTELSITPTEEECPDPMDAWMICHNATPEVFWTGENIILYRCSETEDAIKCIRERGL